MIDTHFRKQQRLFDRQLVRKSYTLLAWHKTYLDKMNQYLFHGSVRGKTILDIGPGEGYVTVEMAKRGARVIACDISREVLKNMRSYKKEFHLSTVKVVHANAENLPLSTASVDYIVANAVLEHLPHETKAITEWKRVLKHGGRIIVAAPISLWYVWPFFWPINILYDRHLGHLRRYSKELLVAKFGMTLVVHWHTGHLGKVLGFFVQYALGIHRYDDVLEGIDAWSHHIPYGASNVVVVLEKQDV